MGKKRQNVGFYNETGAILLIFYTKTWSIYYRKFDFDQKTPILADELAAKNGGKMPKLWILDDESLIPSFSFLAKNGRYIYMQKHEK